MTYQGREDVSTSGQKIIDGLVEAVDMAKLIAENARLRTALENIRIIWQAECDKPSGRMEDRRIFYDTFAPDGPLGSNSTPEDPGNG